MTLSNKNGRNTYDTSISKFLYGGRLSKALTGENKIVNGMEDPSFFAFMFGIDDSFAGLFGMENKNNLSIYDYNNDKDYSVLSYLNNCISPNSDEMLASSSTNGGQSVLNSNDLYDTSGTIMVPKEKWKTFRTEYTNMSKFIKGFKEITINHPYMLQTVEGLQDAYKKYYNSQKDSYLGGNDTKIKIKCLESMDLRMSALFDSYFRSVYNHKYRRMNIPRNLLTFDSWILVHDLRNLKINSSDLKNAVNGGNITKDIISNLSTILFRFKNCWFDIDEIGSMLSSISNAEANQTTFDFSFNYTDIDIYVNSLADILENGDESEKKNIKNNYDSRYDKLDIVLLNDDRRVQFKDNATDDAMNRILGDDNTYDDTLDIGGFLKKAGSSIFNYTTQGSFLGNVYDESWAGILSSMMSSISAGGVRGIINGAIGKGMTWVKDKGTEWANEKLFGKESNDIAYTNTVSNEINGESMESGNVYDYSETERTFENENVYSGASTNHEQLTNDTVDMSTNGNHQKLESYTVDMSTNGNHESLTVGNIYNDTIDKKPYIGEYIEFSETSHEQLKEGNIYSDNTNEKKENIEDLGYVYSINQIYFEYIPLNVYDRIRNGNGIGQVYTNKNQDSVVDTKPIRETKALNFEKMNANAEKAKQKIVNQFNNIGNVY